MNSLFAALDAGDKVKLTQLINYYRDSKINFSGAGPTGNNE